MNRALLAVLGLMFSACEARRSQADLCWYLQDMPMLAEDGGTRIGSQMAQGQWGERTYLLFSNHDAALEFAKAHQMDICGLSGTERR